MGLHLFVMFWNLRRHPCRDALKLLKLRFGWSSSLHPFHVTLPSHSHSISGQDTFMAGACIITGNLISQLAQQCSNGHSVDLKLPDIPLLTIVHLHNVLAWRLFPLCPAARIIWWSKSQITPFLCRGLSCVWRH